MQLALPVHFHLQSMRNKTIAQKSLGQTNLEESCTLSYSICTRNGDAGPNGIVHCLLGDLNRQLDLIYMQYPLQICKNVL